jgi:hypothetical protein
LGNNGNHSANKLAEIIAERIADNPCRRSFNLAFREVLKNKRLVRPEKMLQRLEATRQGVGKLKQAGMQEHIPNYVREALVKGQTCPKKFLESVQED